MNGRKKVILSSIGILSVACLMVTALAVKLLYNAAFDQERSRLINVATRQARLIESIWTLNTRHGGNNSGDNTQSFAIKLVREAYSRHTTFGRTGELVFARREGDSMMILLHLSGKEIEQPAPIPFNSRLAEPMRRALSGGSGWVIGPDYRGETVLAAHEPIPQLGLGIVAKTDLSEIRKPFIRAGLYAGMASLLTIVTGSFLIFFLSDPLIRSVEESKERYRALIDASSQVLYRMSPDWSEMRQLKGGSFLADTEKPDRNWLEEYIHPDDRKWVLEVIGKAVQSGAVFELEHRVRQADGALGWTASRAVPVRNAAGEIIEWFGAASDITERKQFEEALRLSEERFRRLVEVSSNMVWVTNGQGEPLEDSPSWRGFAGRTFDQWRGWNWLDAFHPDDREHLANTWRASLSAVTPYRVEARMRHAGGEYRHVLCQAAPILDADGSMREWVGMNTDVTEQKRMEEELRKSRDELELRVEERTAELIQANEALRGEISQRKQIQEELRTKTQLLSAILENLPVGVWITDSQGKIIEANPAVKKIWGGAHYVGMEGYGEYKAWWADSGERVQMHEWAVLRAIEKGEVSLDEVIDIETFDGKRKTILNSALPIRDGNGISAAIVVNQDITELKQAEKALREKSRFLEAFFEHTLNPLTFLDRDFNFIRVNGAYAKSCEKKAEYFPGRNHFELYPHAENQAIFEEVARTGKPYQAIAKPFGFPDHPEWGVTYWDWTLIPIMDDTGEIDFLVFSLMDVTGRKRAEEERKIYMEKLEESNRALDDFASIASHDMQEPLRKIITFGDQLKARCGDSLDDTGRDFLARMQKAANRMQTLLLALLDYSRISSKPESMRPVDLNQLVRDVTEDLEVRIAQTGGAIKMEKLPTIEAAPHQMRQLFQNLIGNALKFHREGEKPLVKLSCRQTEDGCSCEILVEDNGIGFDEQYAERIFAPFHRLHGRSAFEGTGMGLAICKKIVERHGGTLTARSKPGEGATFTIALPEKQTSRA